MGPSKQKYMYGSHIPNDFRGRPISLCSSKIVDKKEILRNVPDTVIYCSGEKVGTIYTYYNTFSKIPPPISVCFAARVRTWRVALLSAS
jgi:hypothetical protein